MSQTLLHSTNLIELLQYLFCGLFSLFLYAFIKAIANRIKLSKNA